MSDKSWSVSRREVLGMAPLAVFTAVAATRSLDSAEKPQPGGKEGEGKPALVTSDTLGGADRTLTYVNTDKPMYRPGEKVYVRGVVLNAHTHVPLPVGGGPAMTYQILGPKGDVVATGATQVTDSIAGFAWDVPPGQAGGEYKVKLTSTTGDAPAERKFDVRAYRASRLKNQIVFVRDGYGPGDAVSATLKTERAEGGIPDGARVTIQARVDGEMVHEAAAIVDPSGVVSARFDLPKEISRGEGTLAYIIEDGGVVETASKTIPILLQTVDLTMYAEGGELVAGLPNRVYLAALTPSQKPADLKGAIVDSSGKSVAEFRTEHEGRGRFTLTPKAGEKYTLTISEPAGIKSTYPLPEVKDAGVVVTSVGNVVPGKSEVKVRLGSATAGKFKVQLLQREKELSQQSVEVKAGKLIDVSLDAKDASGVLVVTVWNEEGIPTAERLVFREQQDGVQVTVKADRKSYTPGSPVKLTVKSTDADGKPVSALVGVTITDDAVLEMIEKREQVPRLPVMVLLESDVKDLADAHVYLDPKNEKATLAVDLLLGTQGWRRFAFVKTAEFLSQHGDSSRRVVAMRTAPVPVAPGGEGFGFGGGGAPMRFFRNAGALPQAGAPLPAPAAAPGGVAGAVPKSARVLGVADERQELPKSEVKSAPAAARGPRDNAPNARDPNGKFGDLQADQKPAAEKDARKRLEEAVDGKRDADEGLIIGGDRAFAKRKARIGNQAGWVIVREFAHAARPDRKPGDRVDFAETLYWNAGVRTNPHTGEADVAFAMNDSVTSFRIFADAVSEKGALGTSSSAVSSVEPFYVEPKLPLEVSSGDIIRLPMALVNRTKEDLSEAAIRVEAAGLASVAFDPFTLPADSRVRRVLTVDVGQFHGTTSVVLNAQAGAYSDKVTRPLTVKPLGFPIEIGKGGMLAADASTKHELQIPGNIVPGTLKANVSVYPTPLASMTAALERLIQEPCGCFEQTSSSVYPLIMAQQYFTTHTGIDPAIIQKSNDILERGYTRLMGFECKSGGFEWFGENPGHEALTAYGLLEFTDMAAVRPVDTKMIDRTRTWLAGRRDGQGGFKRERRALHTWIEDKDCSNAYIAWSLLRAGVQDLASEVAAVRTAGEKSSNSYVLALSANVLHRAGDKDGRNKLLDRLVQLQEPNGEIKGATTSIVGSGGEALTIETTALATLAWLTDEDYIDFADKGVKYLAEVCKGGRFGSTQSTVLAVQAIVEQDKLLAKPKADGTLQLMVDGKPIGAPVKFDTKTQGAIVLPDMTAALTTGKHEIEVKMVGGSSMPHTVTITLASTQPDSAETCALRVETSLADKSVAEGAITEARLKVTNTKDEAVPTPIALIGIPGGLEVRHDQLKELVKSKRIAAYEVIGRDVVLYWRELAAKQSVELPLSLVASIPGDYTGPASRAYLYYTDELKQWASPLEVTVKARDKE
jgi:hypothetical protein